MADELRERARAFLKLNGYHSRLDVELLDMLHQFAAAERALAIESAAKVADELGDSAEECFKELRQAGLSCAVYSEEQMFAFRKAAKKICSLTPLPTDGEDFGDVSEDQK